MKTKIGYIRVSTREQNTIRQEVLMETLGVEFVNKKESIDGSFDFGMGEVVSFSRDLDVVGKSWYPVFAEVVFQDDGTIAVKFPND